ncbi:hypothetical protein NEOKW01_1797 [Nematocida sp. AWRm80]|nr:hypothetical protein NEOKW01_1797 [Nematocida sp. AWRm80]
MSRTVKERIINGIVKIRKTALESQYSQASQETTLAELVLKEMQRNIAFRRMCTDAPTDTYEKLMFLICKLQTETDSEVVGQLVEKYLFTVLASTSKEQLNTTVNSNRQKHEDTEQTPSKALKLFKAFIERPTHETAPEAISTLFYAMKKIAVSLWDYTTEPARMIAEHSFPESMQIYQEVVISEIIKILGLETAETNMLFSPLKSKVYALSNLALDINHQKHFNIESYIWLYKSQPVESIPRVLECIKERSDRNTLEEIAIFLVDALNVKDIAPFMPFLPNTVLIERLDCLPPKSVVDLYIQCISSGLYTADLIDTIVNSLFGDRLLQTAKESMLYYKKQYLINCTLIVTSIKALALATISKIKDHINAMLIIDSFNTMIIVLSEPGLFEESALSNSLYALPTDSITDFLMEAVHKKDTSAIDKSDTSCLSLLKRYISGYQKDNDLQDIAFQTGMLKVNSEQYDASIIMPLITNNIAGTPILTLALRMIKPTPGSTILSRCIENSIALCKVTTAKEQEVQISSILSVITESEQAIVGEYFCKVFKRLPQTIQWRLLKDSCISTALWTYLMQEYKTNESIILSALTSTATLTQFIPADKSQYKGTCITKLEGEQLVFVLMHILETSYTLQYLQLIDALGVFNQLDTHTCNNAVLESNSTIGWSINTNNDIPVLEYHEYIDTITVPSFVQSILISSETQADTKETDTKDQCLTVKQFYSVLKAKVISCLENHHLKDLALKIFTGKFMDLKAEGPSTIKKLTDTTPALKEIFLTYMKNNLEYKPFTCIFPELEMILPVKRQKQPILPQASQPSKAKRTKTENDAINIIEEKEDMRKTGIISAQLSVSKQSQERDIIPEIKHKLCNLSESQLTEASQYFFEELNRFWKTDREKISKHFETVISAISLFSDTPHIVQAQTIITAYFKFSSHLNQKTSSIVQDIIKQVVNRYPIRVVCKILSSLLDAETRIISSTSQYLKTLALFDELAEYALSNVPNTNSFYLCTIEALAGNTSSLAYPLALSHALSLMDTRNDDILISVLYFLKEEYKSNPVSETSKTIVNQATKILLCRTKLDTAGSLALEIVQDALFNYGYVLGTHDQADLLASIKYDVHHYQYILLHFIDQMPVEEILVLISNINTPEYRSSKDSLKEAIEKFTPSEKEGPKVFSALVDQTAKGSIPDRLFVLSIISRTFPKLVQGNWLTIFIKLCESLANETNQEVIEAILTVLQDILKQSNSYKQIKQLYKEWKRKPALTQLTDRLFDLFH